MDIGTECSQLNARACVFVHRSGCRTKGFSRRFDRYPHQLLIMTTTGQEEGGSAYQDKTRPISIHPNSKVNPCRYCRVCAKSSARFLQKQAGCTSECTSFGQQVSRRCDSLILFLSSNGFRYELSELPHIFFSGIERA